MADEGGVEGGGTGRQQAKLYTEEKKFIAVISIKDCPAKLEKKIEISKFEKRINKATAVKLDLDSPVKLNCAMKDEKQHKAFASLVRYLHKQKKSARIGVEGGDLLLVAPSDGSVKVLRCFFRPGPTRKGVKEAGISISKKPVDKGGKRAEDDYKRFAEAMKSDKKYSEEGGEDAVGQKRKSRWDKDDGQQPPPQHPPMGAPQGKGMPMGSPMGKGMGDPMGKGGPPMMGKGGPPRMGKGGPMGKGGMMPMHPGHGMGSPMGKGGMMPMDPGKGKGGKGFWPPPGGPPGGVYWPPGQGPPMPGQGPPMPHMQQPPLPPPPLPHAPLPPQPPQPLQPPPVAEGNDDVEMEME
jgi:hypothetical protein